MRALVIGGTSGLGYEIAKMLRQRHDPVVITGRHYSESVQLTFRELSIGSDESFSEVIDSLLEEYSPFETIVYNPGFYQEGLISDLTDPEIFNMVNVGFVAAALLVNRVLQKQPYLPCFIAVTSTSQWTPREHEPVYTAVKAALGMLANSLSLDARIGKTLVVAPSGMRTKFWSGTGKDTGEMLEARWVCDQIAHLLNGEFSYKYARVLRGPARVELVEVR